MEEQTNNQATEATPSAPAATPPAAAPAPAETGYAKKGSWMKWVLIYLVIAVVVYGIIWYFFLRDTGSTNLYGG